MLEVVDDELGIIDIDEAIDIIRDKLDELAPEEEEVIIFSWPEVITPEDKIQPYLGPNLESPGEVLPYDGWFFWVDYYPYAGFAHPALYVFVDPETGEVSTSDQEWWPLLNGEGLWVNTIDYWDEANWAFSWVEWRPSSLEGISITIPLEPTVQQNGSPGAALVVNGWSLEQTLKEDSQYNADGIIGALRGNGYDPDYLGPQAYFNPESIREWIADQSLELGPGQTATIYITGHGANRDGSGLISVGGYLLFEEDLAYWLSMFDPGVNVVVILDACYSGSFIDGLSEVADMVITSTDAEHISAGDYDPLETPDSEKNDPNPKDLGTEFSSGLIEDYNEIRADPTRVAQVQAIADGNNISFTQALWGESWYSACAKDVTYLRGLTFPQIFRSVPLSLPPVEEISDLEPLPPEPLEISFVAAEGQPLMDTYYPAAVSPSGVIVLHHWVRGDQYDWTEIAYWLQNRGLGGQTPPSTPYWDPSWYPTISGSNAVFTYTSRGCEGGCSDFYPDGWLLDSQAAMETAMGLDGVEPHRIFSAGASMGADGAVYGAIGSMKCTREAARVHYRTRQEAF